MTRLLLALLAAGCAANPAPPAEPFDADGWLQRARIAAAGPDAGDPGQDLARQFSAELDAAAGWSTACDTWWDPEADEMRTEDDPMAVSRGRGTYTIEEVADGVIVSVLCAFGAYQGSYALVHIANGEVQLLRGQGVDLDGEEFGTPNPIYSTPSFNGTEYFSSFGLSRGLGDCGIYSTYEITAPGTATLIQARARDCEGDPDDAGAPDMWPVVFDR